MAKKRAVNLSGVPPGISRRDFIKFCSIMAAGMGLPPAFAPRIAAAITASKRPPVVWLSAQECTGCTETLLRTDHPAFADLILDLISLDYSETLNSGAGHQSEAWRKEIVSDNEGKFILVCEGSFPVKDGGIYCQIAGRPVVEILRETAPKAAAIIAIGSCASWGGVPSASPNPTGATAVDRIIVDRPVINIPGCPPNPYNFLSTVLYYVTFKKLPDLDSRGRPRFAYGRLIHENCERRPHFDAGRFAEQFGDDGHRKGWCLYKLGCKGPETFNNCPTLRYNDVGVWPVNVGHPCFGCSEQGVGFDEPLFSPARPTYITPPTQFAKARPDGGAGGSTLAAAGVGAVVGAAAVAAGVSLGKKDKDHGEE